MLVLLTNPLCWHLVVEMRTTCKKHRNCWKAVKLELIGEFTIPRGSIFWVFNIRLNSESTGINYTSTQGTDVFSIKNHWTKNWKLIRYQILFEVELNGFFCWEMFIFCKFWTCSLVVKRSCTGLKLYFEKL